MSIIIQAGHATSNSKQLMERLYQRGLVQPANSYTHKMTPQQVTETLYKVLARDEVSFSNEKVADNVMTDFLLANLDSESWGWESDKNLATLEYWKQVEPDARFILVFDHPNNILKGFVDSTLTSDMIDQAMNEWVDYHQKVLSFLKNNNEKTILVEGVDAFKNINNLSKQIKTIANSLQLKSSWQLLSDNNQKLSINTNENDEKNVVVDILSIEILRKYPEVIKTFNLLLDKASLKNSDPIYKTKNVGLNKLVEAINYTKDIKIGDNNLIQEENTLSKEKQVLERRVSESEKIVAYYKNENKKLKEQIDINQEKQKNDLALEISKSKEVIENYKKELSILKEKEKEKGINEELSNTKILKLEEENKILIDQLHHTQEEFESLYTKVNQPKYSIEKKTEDLFSKNNALKIYNISAADRVKKDLPYRLGAQIVNAKKPRDLAILPLTLANEYREFKKGTSNIVNISGIEDSRDLEEVKRVKQHLSYRLGNVLVEGFKSPKKIAVVPIKMSKEIINFKR